MPKPVEAYNNTQLVSTSNLAFTGTPAASWERIRSSDRIRALNYPICGASFVFPLVIY